MNLRAKILVALLIVLAMVVSLLSFNTLMAKRESLQMKHLVLIHQKYSALLNLKIYVDRQLSEAQAIFIYGKEFEGGFQKSTASIKSSMEELIASVKVEKTLAEQSGGSHLQAIELTDVQLVKLQHMYEDINRQIVLMGRLISVGRNAKAVDHFKREVHQRFNDFFAEIDEWTVIERKKLADIESLYLKLSQRHNFVSIIGLFVILLIVLFYSFTFIYLLGPRLRDLLNGTRQIAEGDFNRPINEKGKDEFSELARSMNQMMKELSISRKKLLEQSYYSGMADMVSGTLHNLRNALAPVIVELEVIETNINDVRLERFYEVVKELKSPVADPERFNSLLEYAQLSLKDISTSLPEMSESLSSARKKLDLVEKVLNDQSGLSVTERPLETVTLSELLNESLSLVKQDYLKKVDLIMENIESAQPIKTQRIIVVQIFSNLINNAIESILQADMSTEAGKVVISVDNSFNEEQKVHMKFTDNGIGIESQMLQKIFARGVSGKEKGYGLGLHWCANSIASLEGSIRAESDGPGCGATMHIII